MVAKMIDFVAYHDLQAQCGMSVYNELKKTHDCRWRINPDQEYDGADTLIMLDHAPHHPKLYGKYKYKFHLPHDIGDTNVYKYEMGYLHDYTVFFVPTDIHIKKIKEVPEYKNVKTVLTGWQKYDAILNISETAQDIVYHLVRCKKPVVMYAPTSGHTWEWKKLLPELFKLDATIVIKNHIYLNPGQQPPHTENQAYNKFAADTYKTMLESADQMEEYAVKQGAIIAPRRMNACELFENTNVLISDTSSLLVEFLPFGVSIETGRISAREHETDYQMSNMFYGIYKYPYIKLSDIFSLPKMHSMIEYNPSRHYGKEIADIIRGMIK